jgi:hypothetical protein
VRALRVTEEREERWETVLSIEKQRLTTRYSMRTTQEADAI